jgi:hypothetical protein
MSLDFNERGPQRSFDVIPDGTLASVLLKIRPGGAGEGGWLRRANDGGSEALDCQFTLLDGPFNGRKFWTLLTVAGTTKGHAEAADISGRTIRAMLESARDIKPKDESDQAKQGRRLASYGDLDGMSFIVSIGVEPPQNGYKAKNRLDRVITPDEKGWHSVPQTPKPPAGSAAPAMSAKPLPRRWRSGGRSGPTAKPT